MKVLSLLLASFLLFTSAADPVVRLKIDPSFLGIWKLNIDKSDFGSKPKPQSGIVNWTERGWIYAIVGAGGSLHADAVMTGNGCAMIGVPNIDWCTIKISSSHHLIFVLHEGCDPVRSSDIQLLDRNTVQTINHVFPDDGSDYVETLVWERKQ